MPSRGNDLGLPHAIPIVLAVAWRQPLRGIRLRIALADSRRLSIVRLESVARVESVSPASRMMVAARSPDWDRFGSVHSSNIFPVLLPLLPIRHNVVLLRVQ